MSGELFQKSYQLVEEQLALFNEEHYVAVWKLPLTEYDEEAKSSLFDMLFAFENPDLELQIDVSEESRDVWYLQLLIPYLFTPADLAKKRLQRGGAALTDYLKENGIEAELTALIDDEIYQYLKRYNPEIAAGQGGTHQ